MNFFLNLKEAMQSLSSNKMRSLLTILGIVIGVASVIALLSIGQSAGDSITGEIESIGTNVIYILKGNDDEDVTNPEDLTCGTPKRWRVLLGHPRSLTLRQWSLVPVRSPTAMWVLSLPSQASPRTINSSRTSPWRKVNLSPNPRLKAAARSWFWDHKLRKP